METVLKANDRISQLWGQPKPKDVNYRLMKYLIQCRCDKGLLLHNAVTGHMVLLSEEEAILLQELPSKPTEPILELITQHFLVPEDYNEYKAVNQLRAICKARDTGDAINHYIILPTTFCNAHCFYCYESDYPRVHMTEEIADKIIDYIDKHCQGKEVLLSWFGGEPLVGMARIDQISQGMKERQIPFSSTMISNGYLFDENVIDRSKNLWNLKRVQITLDGTEKIYNQVKAYISVKDNPFQRVLRNIDLLSSKDINVNIRLNIDFYNKDDIRILIEELGKKYSENKHVSAYLNMLFQDQGFEPVRHSQEDIEKLFDIINDYTECLKQLRLSGDRTKIPVMQYSQCMADNPHAVMIQPDGSFCRCEHENVHDNYGNINDGILNSEKLKLWKENIIISEDCSNCSLYPSCYRLRKCMNSDSPCFDGIRMRHLKMCETKMKLIYKKYMEDKDNEGV